MAGKRINKSDMAKKSSIIDNGFEAAYGTLILIQNQQAPTVSGFDIGAKDAELPSGTVVAVGSVPWRFRLHGMKVGSTAYYARIVAGQIPLSIGGVEYKCKAILWSDLRGWAPGADSLPAGINLPNEKRSIKARIRNWLYAVGTLFAAGFVTGVLAAPFINWLSSIKDWFAGRKGNRKSG